VWSFFFVGTNLFFKGSFAVLLLMGETNRALDSGGHLCLSRFRFLGKDSDSISAPLRV